MATSERSRTIRRRLRTVPLFLGGFLVATAALPLLLAVSLVVDAARRLARGTPWMATRLLFVLWLYLAVEAACLAALTFTWVAARGRHERLAEAAWGLQAWWAAVLMGAIRRAFGLRFEVEGSDGVPPGPIVVFMRHASIIDNLVPATFVAAPHGIQLRYVLKRELLSDPAIDIAGNRLPNVFVARGSDDAERQIDFVRELAQGLGAGEGMLIYPEGTRFTEAKRARALEKLASADPRLHAAAQRLHHVLPPRLGGPLALLDAGADVVVCAHHGLDGFSHLKNIWEGGLIGRTVRIRFTRFPHSDIPPGREQRIDWILARWQEVDDWIGAQARA